MFGNIGEQADLETGFLHLRARACDPGTGRFLQRDPVAGAGRAPTTLNRYAYVLNNPVNYVDPSGNCPQCLGGFVTGAIIGGAVEGARGGDARDVAAAAAKGAVEGLGAAALGPLGAGLGAGVGEVIGEAIKGEPVDSGKVARATAAGLAGGVVGVGGEQMADLAGASEAVATGAGVFTENATSNLVETGFESVSNGD